MMMINYNAGDNVVSVEVDMMENSVVSMMMVMNDDELYISENEDRCPLKWRKVCLGTALPDNI